MDKIFISYRREDSEGFARSLFQSLVARFGKDHVFMDVEAIGLGVDFVEAIDSSLADCGVLLVLIGTQWVSCTDGDGQRRLEKDDDFVRIEVARALERKVRVIPILVKGAQRPKAEELPEELRSLTRLQDLELRHETWDANVNHLADQLEKLLGLKRLDDNGPPDPVPPPPEKKPRPFLTFGLVGIGIVAAMIFIVSVFMFNASDPDPAVVIKREKVDIKPTPNPTPKPTPKPAPRPAPRILNLTGLWIDDDGAQVNFVQTGTTAVSRGIDPETGALVQANWQLNDRKAEFNWMAATGNRGYGRGVISTDHNSIRYEYVDTVTGERGTGLLTRASQ